MFPKRGKTQPEKVNLSILVILSLMNIMICWKLGISLNISRRQHEPVVKIMNFNFQHYGMQ